MSLKHGSLNTQNDSLQTYKAIFFHLFPGISKITNICILCENHKNSLYYSEAPHLSIVLKKKTCTDLEKESSFPKLSLFLSSTEIGWHKGILVWRSTEKNYNFEETQKKKLISNRTTHTNELFMVFAPHSKYCIIKCIAEVTTSMK